MNILRNIVANSGQSIVLDTQTGFPVTFTVYPETAEAMISVTPSTLLKMKTGLYGLLGEGSLASLEKLFLNKRMWLSNALEFLEFPYYEVDPSFFKRSPRLYAIPGEDDVFREFLISVLRSAPRCLDEVELKKKSREAGLVRSSDYGEDWLKFYSGDAPWVGFTSNRGDFYEWSHKVYLKQTALGYVLGAYSYRSTPSLRDYVMGKAGV